MNRATIISYLTSPKATSFIDATRSLFASVPHLPVKVKEILVQIIPWLIVVSAVLGAINGVEEVLYSVGVNKIGEFVDNHFYLFLSGVLDIIAAYLGFLAFPLLRNKDYQGWVLLFWTTTLSVVMSALTLLLGFYAILGIILTVAIGYYLTFEVEDQYTTGGKVINSMNKTAEKVIKPSKKPSTR